MLDIDKQAKCRELLKDIQVKLDNWNERSQFVLKGVDNLSRSDLDTLELYAKHYLRNGNFDGLMQHYSYVRDVLKKYHIVEDKR